MKKLLIGLFVLNIGLVYADNESSSSTSDMVKVLSVKPNYVPKEVSVPSEICTSTTSTQRGVNSSGSNLGRVTGAIVGGVGGAVAGNQINQGGAGSAIGAVVGVIGGLIAGNAMSQTDEPVQSTSTTCTTGTTTKYKKVLDGYIVTYIYKGKKYNTITVNRPTSNYLPIEEL